jgi:hypothetical protein
VVGGYGVQRKVAGAEQMLTTLPQKIGMGMMGLGGLIAVIGGLMFVLVCLQAMSRRARDEACSMRWRWRSGCRRGDAGDHRLAGLSSCSSRTVLRPAFPPA